MVEITESNGSFNMASSLKYITSTWTVKKDIVIGIDLAYLLCCSLFFNFFLNMSVWGFFLCGMMWTILPSNHLERAHYKIVLEKYPELTKFFYSRGAEGEKELSKKLS